MAVQAEVKTRWKTGMKATSWRSSLPSAKNLADSNAAFHEWLGIAIYRLRGWM